MTKTDFILLLTTIFAIVKSFTEQYLFCDWEFFIFLNVLVITDGVLGVWKHYILHTISSSGIGQGLKKLGVYGLFLILAHVMKNYTVDGEKNVIFSWFPNMIYFYLVVKEAISIIENIGVVYPNSVPTWLLKRLKEYDQKGKFTKN